MPWINQPHVIWVHSDYTGCRSACTTVNCPNCAPSTKGSVLAHEVGHHLGLLHTDGTPELKIGCRNQATTSCDEWGDYCCDTPEDVVNSGGSYPSCTNTNGCSSTSQSYTNFMDIGDDGCRSIFTTCQVNRMFDVLNGVLNKPNKPYLANYMDLGTDCNAKNVGCLPPDPPSIVEVGPFCAEQDISLYDEFACNSGTSRMFGSLTNGNVITVNPNGTIDALSANPGSYQADINHCGSVVTYIFDIIDDVDFVLPPVTPDPFSSNYPKQFHFPTSFTPNNVGGIIGFRWDFGSPSCASGPDIVNGEISFGYTGTGPLPPGPIVAYPTSYANPTLDHYHSSSTSSICTTVNPATVAYDVCLEIWFESGSNQSCNYSRKCQTVYFYYSGTGGHSRLKPKGESVNYNIYPNPTNGSFNISNTELDIRQVEVYTISGSLVRLMNAPFGEIIDMNLNESPPGIYLLKILNHKEEQSIKLIKE